MKHTTTHKMLDMVLAVALAVLAGGSFISIRAQAAVSALPQRATLSTAPLTNAGGSPRDVEDEIVRVDTQLSRVIVSVEQPGPLTWEVTDDGRAQKDLLLDGPDRPLQLVILVDLAAEREKKSEECHYQRLQRELDTLARRVRLQSPPLVVVSSPRAPRLPYDLKWPSSWETVFASDLRGALDTSINRLERGPGTVRRALLLLTNRADELPPDTFEQTDARLAHSAAMVYLMAVKPPRFKATHRKVIVRTNINGGDTVVRLENNYNYVATLFNCFVHSANTMYVVSYHLPAVELDDSPGQPATRYVRAAARSSETGKLLAWNERRYVTGPAAGVPAAFAGDETMRSAIIAVTSGCPPKDLLAHQLAMRPAPVITDDRPRFREELVNRPELRGLKLYGPDTDESKRVRSVIKPVLKLHRLEQEVEVRVLDQDAPFMGLYREFILIVSTGELRLLSAPQLRAAAGHELSHLFFVAEMRAADLAGDLPAHHLIEYKCDILAALSSELVGDAPESVIEAVSLVEAWYQEAGRDDYEKSLHPTARQRQEALRLYLSQARTRNQPHE